MKIYSNKINDIMDILLIQIKEKTKESNHPLYKKISLYLEQSQVIATRRLITKKVNNCPSELYYLVHTYIDIYEGRLFKADKSIGILNNSYPNPLYTEILGDINFALSKFKRASYYYKRLLIVDEFNKIIQSKLASVYLNLGEWDNALDLYKKIPLSSLTVEDKANINICKDIIKADPTRINIVYLRGKKAMVDIIQIGSIDIGQGVYCTGNVDDSIRESAFVALSYLIKSKYTKNIKGLDKKTFHLHFPSSYSYKSGPSGGLSILIGLYNHINNISSKSKIAYTGEIDIEGNIYAIGGIEEKIQACIEKGIELFFIPRTNVYASSILYPSKNIKIIPVKRVEEVIEYYERIN